MLLLSKRHLIDIKKGVQIYQSNQSIDNKLYNDNFSVTDSKMDKFQTVLTEPTIHTMEILCHEKCPNTIGHIINLIKCKIR